MYYYLYILYHNNTVPQTLGIGKTYYTPLMNEILVFNILCFLLGHKLLKKYHILRAKVL